MRQFEIAVEVKGSHVTGETSGATPRGQCSCPSIIIFRAADKTRRAVATHLLTLTHRLLPSNLSPTTFTTATMLFFRCAIPHGRSAMHTCTTNTPLLAQRSFIARSLPTYHIADTMPVSSKRWSSTKSQSNSRTKCRSAAR